ncbi:hypothetical protein EBZ39_01435 [bacterium]|nr:hypothetical protein [bacterium]
MFNWIMTWFVALFSWAVPHANIPPHKDYIGVVAAEVAYAATLASRVPDAPPRVDPKNCATCGGTGRVPSGDGQGWTKCPACQSKSAVAPVAPISPARALLPQPYEVKQPKAEPNRYKPQVTGTHTNK